MRRRLLALLCALVTIMPLAFSAPAAAAGGTVWHVVGPDDTMRSVAARYGIKVADLGRWNQIVAPYPVHVDETLRLTRPASPLPAWRTRVEPVTPGMVNWDPAKKCPVPPADLRRIWVSYLDLRGAYHDGSIIMHKSLVARTQQIFLTLFRWRYRIMAMSPMQGNMPGVTDYSIVTAGYICRPVSGSKKWSEHAYGRAIDINPLQNPMIRGTSIDPPAGRPWVRRNQYKIGMLHPEGAVRAFTRQGFHWGGRWTTLKDYMHVSTTNR
jgi:LysM repeat protein